MSEALAAASPRLMARRGSRIVVKLGGSAMEVLAALDATLRDIAHLALSGQRVVLVHGGGKAIDRALDGAGIVPVKVRGRRVTDPATLAVVVRVLAGELNADLVQQLKSHGVAAVGLHTGDNQALFGAPLHSPAGDLGKVGEVTRVDVARLEELTADGIIAVLPSLAIDEAGGWLNVNADDAATAVAVAWKADALAFLTDTPGILRDVQDPSSRFERLTAADIVAHIGSGVITGGMVPKVQGCLTAIEQGVGRVLILDGRVRHVLWNEAISGVVTGTEVV